MLGKAKALNPWHTARGEWMARVRIDPMVIAFILLVGIFSVLTNGDFLSSRNVALLLRQATITAIAASGMVLVIVARQIDLSVGSVAALVAGIAAILQVDYGYDTWIVVVTCLIVAGLVGMIHGFLAAYVGVPAFIVTLGGMLVWRGVILLVTGGRSISGMHDSFRILGQGFLNPTWSWVFTVGLLVASMLFSWFIGYWRRTVTSSAGSAERRKGLYRIAAGWVLAIGAVHVMNRYEGLPVPAIILAVVVLTLGLVAEYTPFGRQLYAIGDNPEAARLAGIDVRKRVLGAFTIMGVVSGITGLVLAARLSGFGSNVGNLLELDAIAAAVIGGTSLTGGEGSVPRAVAGAVVMACIDNGMSLMNVDPFWQYVVKGCMLVTAVAVDLAGKNRRPVD